MTAQELHLGSDDQNVLASLARLQQSFEPSLKTGGETLISFQKSLDVMLAQCSSTTLQGATHKKVSSFVSLVKTISIALLDLEEKSQAIQAAFSAEITRLADVEFKRLSIHDSPRATPMPDSASFSYIEPCYKWLLSHLYNPYPSRKLREQISADTGVSANDIDAWFIDVRKRIGWNRIRRAHFETRADMVKAATRHFKPQARTVRLTSFKQPVCEDLYANDCGAEFFAMQSDAQALYAHKLFPTTIITELDIKRETCSPHRRDPILSYPSPEPTPPRQEESALPTLSCISRPLKKRKADASSYDEVTPGVSRLQRHPKRSRISSSSSNCRSPSCFPSPTQSSHQKLSSGASSSSLPEATSLLRDSKRKRRLSNSSEYDSDSSCAPRAGQRRRVGGDDCGAQLPSVFAGANQHLRDCGVSSALLPTSDSSFQPQTLKRKRRLSDTHEERPRKHPHHPALMVPRLHAVSNPLPAAPPLSDATGILKALPAELPSSSFVKSLDLIDTQDLVIESFDYSSIPILQDYLSQLDAPSNNFGGSDAWNEALAVMPESCLSSQSQGSVTGAGTLGLATSNQLSLLSYDDLSSGVRHGLGSTVSQSLPPAVNSKFAAAYTQNFEPIPDHTASPLSMAPSITNLSNLTLYPALNILSGPQVNPVEVADPLSLSSGHISGGASQAAFAIQRIHALQAELDMCKNQLAHSVMFSF